MKSANAVMIVVAAMYLAGCQSTARDEYGKSPLVISSRLQDAINEYLAAGEPKYFAVAEDGRAYGYPSCHEVQCRTELDHQLARDSCLRMSAGIACKIYARGKIVWEPGALIPASADMPRTVNMPEDGLRRPGRRWNLGRIVG